MFSKIAVLIIATITFEANAQAVFKHDSKLPASLRAIVAAVVNYNCDFGHRVAFEKGTEVSVDRIDQGMTDYFYKTTFVVKDEKRNNVGELVVNSFNIAMYNPTAGVTEGVDSISSDSVACK